MDSVDDRPCLEQRHFPWVTVRTTLHPQGLMVQVARPFRERVGAVGFERLVLEPVELSALRRGPLWTAAALLVAGVASTLPLAHVPLPAPAAPALLGAGVLALLATVVAPRRLTVFMDREQTLHPTFVRGGAQDAEVAGFVEEVRRAIVEFRCRPPVSDEGADATPPDEPSLADRLDALVAMRDEGLLSAAEFDRFRRLAERH